MKQSGRSPMPPEEPKASVLLVDDTPANLVSLRAILEDPDYDLVDARSGEEALERLKAKEFAAVLLDVRMPRLSGFDTAKFVRADDRSRHTPIIFLTADDIDRGQIEAGYALGAVDFFVKPLSQVVVRAKVQGFVRLFQEKQKARQEADQFRLLVQGTTDYAIFMLDPLGRVLTWNAGAERFKGYKADEIVGQHYSKFYPQEALDRGWPAYELKVATAEGRFEDEGWRVRKDGTQFWANVVITALRDEHRQLRGFSKVTRDLTERKKSEEDARRLVEEAAARRVAEVNARLLQEQRERLHVTLASIGDAVISTDAQGRVDFLNPVAEDLVGWNSSEAVGRTLEDVFRIVNEDTRQPVENPALRALREGKVVGLANHTVLISNDGTERPIDDSAAPIRNQHGNISGSVLVFRDISERKRSEAVLRERVRLLALNAAVGEALVQGNDLAAMLQRCAEGLVEHLDAAFARIWTLNGPDGVLELRASAGLYTHLDGPHSRVPVGKYKIGLIAQERKPHLTNEVVGDPRVSDQEWAQREGMIAFAGYPLVVDDRLVGVMALFARKALSEATLAAMASVADEIAVGVERKSAQDRLYEQREWLAVTLASIGDAVIATDALGRVTFLNGVAQGMTGWALADAEGQPLEAVFPIVNEQTRKPVENPVETVLRDGVVVGLGNHTVLIAKNGAERPIDDSAAPIRNAAGEMIGVVLIFRDVTEQRRAEHEVRQSEARKSAILETALDCIITMDHEGNVVEFNPAAEKTFGYRREKVVGKRLADFIIPPSLRERHRHGMAHYLATGEGPVLGKRLELPALRADGTEIPVEIAITRIPTDGLPLFTAYLRDITEQKRAEQHRNVRLGVTHALSEATTVEDGAGGVLRAVCENLGWDVGFFWTVNEAEGSLACRRSWRRPNVAVDDFESASCSRTFKPGEGLPGRVWASGKPAWVLDIAHDGNFPRLAPATKYDLHSAFACPVVVGERTLGVIEFFTGRIWEPDADLLEMMGTVAGNIGQFHERKSAEEQVRQSERELADFFDNATVGLHWVGPDGTILRANRAELDMLGYSREEYVGRPIAEFHADEDVICDILERLQAGEKLNDYPARLRCKDGSIKDVLIDSSVMFRDGTFAHTRCFTRDVTERKRAEVRVREQEQRTRTILESVTDAFFGLGRDWRFTYVNRQAEVLLGRSRGDLLGKNIWEEFAPAVGTDFDRSYHRAMAENVTVTFEAFYPPHDRWYEVHAYPSPDGLSVYFRDVGERKRAEAALKESEEKLRLLADTIPQLAWMARPDGHIFWYNRRWYEYTGTTPEQMEGWGWQSVHDPDTLPRVLERWKGSIASGEPFDMVFPLKGADEQFRPFLTRVNPLRDAQGRILYWFGTNTDISDIKRMEEALRDADRRKDEFLATLAHELRNPLAPIRNALQILKMPRVDAATVERSREMMERQVHQLVRLVDDLLDVSRVMRGKIELRRESVEIATVVARAVETVQPLIDTQGHELSVLLPSESLPLDADPVRLAQVVGNLLTNAAKYTEPGGRIWLTADREGHDAVLRIRDNGIGIAPDVLPRIFELFVQVDHAATRSQGGLGIGLTLVKNLCEMHNGSVEARSAGLGKGSEFVVRLPISALRVEPDRDRETGPQADESPSPSGFRLLVVDDNQDAANSLAMLLKLQGHEVRVAYSGMAALETTKTYTPDVVFMDIGMPGMDGYEAARRIREQPGLGKVVLAALTGWGQQEDRRRTAEAGFDHHLVKPPEPKAVASVLAGLKREVQ